MSTADDDVVAPSSVGSPNVTAVHLGFVCALLTFAWLATANWGAIVTPIFEEGDRAANSILVDQALDLQLLVGHFSRFEFNHPGPAVLYVQAFGDFLFHRILDLAPSSYGGQVVGILALNSACVGAGCWIVSSATGRVVDGVALLGVVPVFNVWEAYALTSTWMPAVLISMFLLMIVSAAAICEAQWRFLWILTASAAACLHSHASLIPFVAVSILAALAVGWRRVRQGEVPRPARRDALRAAIVAGVFIAPLAANLVVNWPGEFGRYVRYLGRQDTFVPRTFTEAMDYTASFWMRSGHWTALLFVGSVVLAIVMWRRHRGAHPASFRRSLLLMVTVQSVLFFAYSKWVVDDLKFLYLGWFYLACPMLVLWVGLSTSLSNWSFPRAKPVAILVCAGIAVSLISMGTTTDLYRGIPEGLARALPRGDVRISASGGDSWPTIIGWYQYALNQGDSPCFVEEAWRIFVTEKGICTDSDTGRALLIVVGNEPRPANVLYDNGTIAIADDPQAR